MLVSARIKRLRGKALIEGNGCSGEYAPAFSNRLHPCSFLAKQRLRPNHLLVTLAELGVCFSVWRRGGDNTQRGVTRQKPLWNPRGAQPSKAFNNNSRSPRYLPIYRPWTTAALNIHVSGRALPLLVCDFIAEMGVGALETANLPR